MREVKLQINSKWNKEEGKLCSLFPYPWYCSIGIPIPALSPASSLKMLLQMQVLENRCSDSFCIPSGNCQSL